MSRKKDEKWLDEIISQTINSGKPEFDAEQWKQKYPEEFQMLQSMSKKDSRARQPSIWRIVRQSPITRLAAAAVLLIAVGYAVGRLTTPGPDMEQLHSALETSLRASLVEEMSSRWQSAFAANCVQLKDELHQQVRRDLTEFAVQTLAASNSLTEQRLIKLIELIEAARERDRRQVAAALETIEFGRLQDKSQLGKGLVALAAQTSELLGTRDN